MIAQEKCKSNFFQISILFASLHPLGIPCMNRGPANALRSIKNPLDDLVLRVQKILRVQRIFSTMYGVIPLPDRCSYRSRSFCYDVTVTTNRGELPILIQVSDTV